VSGAPPDPALAAEWFRKAARGRLVDAQYNLALMYYRGHGIVKDRAEAARLFYEAASRGSAPAQYHLASMYSSGEGFAAPDHEKAFFWFKEAAGSGMAQAQRALGARYLSGEGTERDPALALSWLHKASEQGDGGAAFLIGAVHEAGDGTPPDKALALKWYSEASGRGDPDGAFRAASLMLASGSPDGKAALRHLEASADAGHPLAKLLLAAVLRKGDLAPADPLRAGALLDSALATGDPDALCAYATELLENPDSSETARLAMETLKRLAGAGHPQALNRLEVPNPGKPS
jgi:TPR repeat protein